MTYLRLNWKPDHVSGRGQNVWPKQSRGRDSTRTEQALDDLTCKLSLTTHGPIKSNYMHSKCLWVTLCFSHHLATNFSFLFHRSEGRLDSMLILVITSQCISMSYGECVLFVFFVLSNLSAII